MAGTFALSYSQALVHQGGTVLVSPRNLPGTGWRTDRHPCGRYFSRGHQSRPVRRRAPSLPSATPWGPNAEHRALHAPTSSPRFRAVNRFLHRQTRAGRLPPGGDLVSQILRDLEKAIREGRLKPVVIGPYEVEIPGQ